MAQGSSLWWRQGIATRGPIVAEFNAFGHQAGSPAGMVRLRVTILAAPDEEPAAEDGEVAE